MSSEGILLSLNDSVLWAPYKALFHVVNNAVACKDIDAVPDLEAALKTHKPNFICLLKNPARNQIHREAVKKASSTGIAVSGQSGMQILSQQLVDEALIVSDMFELNELTALELLIAGQQQQPHFPGLTRGLVAMLLYYDGRRCLVNALRMLVQAREGKSWTLGLNTELTTLITNFTNQLKEEGMIMKVIDLIENMDISKELELLHKNRALGGPRYRKQVTDLISEIKQSLAEIIFCWTCQSDLSHEEAMRLLNYLAKQAATCSSGTLDEPTLTLAMSFLYVIDVGYLQNCSEMDSGIQKLNLVCVRSLAAAIHKELFVLNNNWQVPGLKAVFQFAWGLSIRTMLQFPITSLGIDLGENFEDDERVVETAIENGAFTALRSLIICSSLFRQEEFFLKRIHNLITDFIVLMPIKVKDMRNSGDESARIIAANAREGLEPPANLPMHFQHFLNLIAETYSKNPLGLDLSLDFWCPVENIMEQSSFSQRPTQRQVTLFKFLRLAGDLLPAPLFVPYHQMLTSLSSSKLGAHHCFNLLKINGRNVVGSHCNLVSWDHFFTTLHSYHLNLREELAVAPGSGYTYRQRMLTKGITPMEVQGLISVLELMSQVVRLDEVARITLADDPRFSPVSVLLGLVTCSVPQVLKASLIRCLAAFAVSPEVAFNIWHGLEDAQVIPTIPTTSVYHPAGILMEIEEVETRNEEYPVTLAILKLLNVLLDHPFPLNLGAGRRQPGLQPYLDFVRDKVLLRCNSRAYKSDTEKWKVIVRSLKVIDKVLRNYRVKAESLNITHHVDSTLSATRAVGTHPGYSIISELLQDSGLLRMVLFVLDEGVRILDMYSPYAAQAELEKAAQLALSLLHETLSRQDAFLQQVRDSNCDLLVTSMDNLLMSINPRSGQVDHLLVISKYVTYNTFIPHHSLLAIRILLLLCSSSQIAQHLISVYDVDPKESDMILHGFVECLEVDVTGEEESAAEGADIIDDTMAQARNKARQELLQLLLNCLRFTAPNLSHFLLGFNIRRSVSQTEIQEPGVMGSRRTCLHAVLSLLDAGTHSTGPVNVSRSPTATGLAYQLIYTLCANRETSGPTLRYLRSTHDFFYRHLQFLPFRSKEKYDPKVLTQQSWLLRAIGIELRVTSAHHQRSHVQRLLLSFLDDKPSISSGAADGITEPAPGLSSMTSFSFIKPNTGPLRRKLMRILDSLDFTQATLPVPQWECFDPDELQKVFKESEVLEPSGLPVIDIDELRHRLTEEISSYQNGSSLAQRSFVIQQEISAVIQYALDFNAFRRAIAAKKQSFDAWRQVTEVLLIACPLDILGSEKKHQMVLEISQELIYRVMSEDFLPDLMPAVSGVILTLTATLRHSIAPPSSSHSEMPFLLPDSSSVLPSSSQLPSRGQPSVPIIHHSSLIVVLKAIVECLLHTGTGLQRVRANFYTALLNLLCIIQKPYESRVHSSGVESAILDQESETRKLRKEYMDTMLSFGETIMEVICRDACTGHDITKMLSLAVLDVAVALDAQQHWLSFLVSRGYLRHILDSLVKDDQQLQELLSRSSSSYRIFYVFESKMALLTRISSTGAGALAMLRNNAIGKLSECRALSLRPDIYMPPEMRREAENWILPDLMKCYRQILKSVMKFILSVMMSLGSRHKELTLQLLGNISCNADFYLNVLRDRSILNDVAGLEELSLVTAVLSRASLDDLDNVGGDAILLENRGQLLLLQHHLLALLPCLLAVGKSRLQWSSSSLVSSEPDAMSQIKLLRLQVAAHILGMCCKAVSHSGIDTGNCRLLFGPSLLETTSPATSYDFSSRNLSVWRSNSVSRAPDLGLIVMLLHQCSSQLQSCVDNHKLLLLRLQSVATLTSEELAEYLPAEVKIEHTTAQRQRELARECLFVLLQNRVREVAVLSYMIESSAYILLRHLEHYFNAMKKSELPISAVAVAGDLSKSSMMETVRRENIYEPSLTQEQFENFKAEVASVLSESFFRKLQSVVQYVSKGRSHVSFLEAIIHRMKRAVKLGAR